MIEKIKIDTIKVKEGGKPVDKETVELLAESMKNGCLINAITVNSKHELIAGEHRLEAAKLLGWTEIEANIQDITKSKAEITKIEENLIRRHLNAVEMGELVNKRDKYLEKEGLKAKSGENQFSGGEYNAPPKKTTAELAKEAAVSKRVYQLNKQLAKYLTPDDKYLFSLGSISKHEAIDRARFNKIILEQKNRETAREVAREKRKQENIEKSINPYGKEDVKKAIKELEQLSEEKYYSCIVYHVTKNNKIERNILLAKKEAVIFVWTSNDMLKDTLSYFNNYIYDYKTDFKFYHIIVWDKCNEHCEFCLVGFNGEDETWNNFINNNNLILPYFLREQETQVGNKPEAFYKLINGIDRKIEYFPNEKREGYEVYIKEDKGIHIDIPIGITHIEKNAFKGVGLTSVTIPNSVTHIGDCAFINNKLTNIIIPDSVKNIGSAAFEDNQLTSIIIPDSVKKIGNAAFYGNQLTSVIIPDSIKKIGYNTFANNKLSNVKIGKKVTTIEERAFTGNEITSVDIPDSLTYITEGAFDMDKIAKTSKKMIMSIVEKTKDFKLQKEYDTIIMLLIKKDYDMTELINIMETIHLEHLFIDYTLYFENFHYLKLEEEERNNFYEFINQNRNEIYDEEREIEIYCGNNVYEGYITKEGYIPKQDFEKMRYKPKKLRLAEYKELINNIKSSEQLKAA
jgi:ParB-like chromosome segregation protein Spo0J